MAHDDEQAWRAAIYDEYRRISSLDDTIAGTLNNILVGGSVGIIVASVTFLKDIAGGQPAPGSLLLLKSSWIILVATAVVSIASLITSRTAGRLHRDVLAKRVANDQAGEAKLKRECNRWNLATTLLQRAGLTGLAAGAGMLVWFAIINLPKEATVMADKDKKVTGVPPERPRPPMPEHREDKAFDHDTSNPFLQRPDTTTPTTTPKDTDKK
jgi:hypothetical protein